MNRQKRLHNLLWCAAFCCLLQPAIGQYESLIFEVPADARTAGLGGRLTADLHPDIHASLFNPAFVHCNQIQQVALDYVGYFGTTTIGGLQLILGTDGRKTWSAGTRFTTFGQLDELDASGQATGNQFFAGDVAIQTSVAWAFEAGQGHDLTAGATLWAGTRSLNRAVSLMAGTDLALRGVWHEQQFSWGLALTGMGHSWGGQSQQPTAFMPMNVQFGLAKSFANAPFTFHLEANQLQKWQLAPDGTYDDLIDPLTGETSKPIAWPGGDALMRHLTIGTELALSEALAIQLGYDYRRRQELRSGDRPGTNGFAIGVQFQVKKFNVRMARNTYHFAGASTHLSLSFDLAG